MIFFITRLVKKKKKKKSHGLQAAFLQRAKDSSVRAMEGQDEGRGRPFILTIQWRVEELGFPYK